MEFFQTNAITKVTFFYCDLLYLKSWFDETKRYCVRRLMVVHEKYTIKPLVYKLWVSDCEIETGNEKRAIMLHQPPLPVQLTIWIYFKISFL